MKKPDRPPDYEDKDIRAWKAEIPIATDKWEEAESNLTLHVDVDTEEALESRIYAMKGGATIKILAKQDKKTKKITCVIRFETNDNVKGAKIGCSMRKYQSIIKDFETTFAGFITDKNIVKMSDTVKKMEKELDEPKDV